MHSVLVAIVVFVLVVEPVLVAAHEFGHALVPLLHGHQTAVFVGGDRGPTATVGALTLTVAPLGLLSAITSGATVTDATTGRWSMFAGALAGPLASLVATILVWRLILLPDVPGLWWLAYATLVYGGLQTASTLAPFSGKPTEEDGEPFKTDGRIALELLLGRDPVLDESTPQFRDFE